MDKYTLETSPNPTIIVRAEQAVRIIGWEQDQLYAEAKKDESLEIVQDNDEITITVTSDAKINVPMNTTLQLVAQAKALVQGVLGSVNVQQASNDLVLREVGPATLASVGRDLNAQGVNGNLSIRDVGRFASVSNVAGNFNADLVGAHLNLSNVAGDIKTEAGGNANLSLTPSPNASITVNALGVLNCQIDPTVPAHVHLTSLGPISAQIGQVKEATLDGELEFDIGDPDNNPATITLSANGPLSIGELNMQAKDVSFDFDFDFDGIPDLANIGIEITETVNRQIGAQMEMLEAQLENLTTNLAGVQIDDERKQEKIERAIQRAERAREKIHRAAQRAQEKTARKMEAAQRRAERQAKKEKRKARFFNFSFDSDSLTGSSPKTKTDAGTEEERMMILQMLAEKKITAEEADTLLAALE